MTTSDLPDSIKGSCRAAAISAALAATLCSCGSHKSTVQTESATHAVTDSSLTVRHVTAAEFVRLSDLRLTEPEIVIDRTADTTAVIRITARSLELKRHSRQSTADTANVQASASATISTTGKTATSKQTGRRPLISPWLVVAIGASLLFLLAKFNKPKS